MKTKLLVLSTTFALAACSGGGSGSKAPVNGDIELSPQFVDAPVNGLTYSIASSGVVGKTKKAGNFSCDRGEVVRFEIGKHNKGLLLGTAVCADKIFIHNLDTATDDDKVKEIGSILQSVAPPVGTGVNARMDIPAEVADLDFEEEGLPLTVAAVGVDGSDDEASPSSFITSLNQKTSLSLQPVKVSAAAAHINSSLEDFFTAETRALLDLLRNGQTAPRSASNFNGQDANGRQLRDNDMKFMGNLKGLPGCEQIPVEFFLGLYKEAEMKYKAYAYTVYSTSERVDEDNSRPFVCNRLGTMSTAEDNECFAEALGEQLITSSTLTMKAKFRDLDTYFAELSDVAPVNINNAPVVYDVIGSLGIIDNRVKGRIVFNRAAGASEDLPLQCHMDIDQGFTEESGGNDGDDEEENAPSFALGTWTGTLGDCEAGAEALEGSDVLVAINSSSSPISQITLDANHGGVSGVASSKYDDTDGSWGAYQSYSIGELSFYFYSDGSAEAEFNLGDYDGPACTATLSK